MSCCRNTSTLRSTVSTVTVDTDSINLTPDSALSPANYQRVSLKLKANITSGFTLPVEVTLGGASVPVYDKAGNVIYGSQLIYGMYLNGYFGTNGSGGSDHLSIMNVPPIVN